MDTCFDNDLDARSILCRKAVNGATPAISPVTTAMSPVNLIMEGAGQGFASYGLLMAATGISAVTAPSPLPKRSIQIFVPRYLVVSG